MMSDKKIQKAGDGSVNVQAETVNITGPGYEEVRQIAQDVFDQNFYRLAGAAAEEARTRVEEFIAQFLRRLEDRNPEGLGAAHDPDFQCALYVAQREYARTGDEDLGSMLIDLLVGRTKEEGRSLRSIVLNESLAVVGKLTPDQIATLSLVFSLGYAHCPARDLNALKEYLHRYIAPLIPKLPSSYASIQHLEYAGCCSVAPTAFRRPLDERITRTYAGLFSRGIESDLMKKILDEDSRAQQLIIPCPRDTSRLQFNYLNEQVLQSKAANIGLHPNLVKRILKLEEEHRLRGDPLWKEFRQMEPQMEDLRKKWDDLHLGNVDLTTVGLAIGHANARRVTGEGAPLSEWIK